MLAWILEYAGLKPGFFNWRHSTKFWRVGQSRRNPFLLLKQTNTTLHFLISAVEFVHYLPRTLILNNLEFDHADILKI